MGPMLDNGRYSVAASGNVTGDVLKRFVEQQDVEPQDDENFEETE